MQLLSRNAGQVTGYPHLTRYERDQIAQLKAQGLGPTAIGAAIGRHKSTIHCPAGDFVKQNLPRGGRELRRNAHQDGAYRPAFAPLGRLLRNRLSAMDSCYMFRRQRPAILERDPELKRFVLDRLAESWTPVQISGWLKRGIERGLRPVSPETIYAFIFRAGQKAEKLWRYLTRRKASRGRRARRSKDKIRDKVHISQRSEAADTRAEAGH